MFWEDRSGCKSYVEVVAYELNPHLLLRKKEFSKTENLEIAMLFGNMEVNRKVKAAASAE